LGPTGAQSGTAAAAGIAGERKVGSGGGGGGGPILGAEGQGGRGGLPPPHRPVALFRRSLRWCERGLGWGGSSHVRWGVRVRGSPPDTYAPTTVGASGAGAGGRGGGAEVVLSTKVDGETSTPPPEHLGASRPHKPLVLTRTVTDQPALVGSIPAGATEVGGVVVAGSAQVWRRPDPTC